MKKFNIYYLFDVLSALAIVFLCFGKKDKLFIFGSAVLFITVGILVILELFEKTQLTQTVVTNNSDKTVMIKPENGSEPEELAPHSAVEGADGINVDGKVFKACSGTHVVIDQNRKITTKALSGKFANFIRGGYITTAPDAGWNNLFKA